MAEGIPGLGAHLVVASFGRFRSIKEPYYVVCDPTVLRRGEQVDGFARVSHPSLRSRLAAWGSPGPAGPARTRTEGRILRVAPGDGAAYRLCELAETLAATSAWSGGLVDRDRLVPAILWRSVRTAFEVARLDEEIEQARRFPALADLVAGRVEQRSRSAAVVDEVHRRFALVLAAARQLDARDAARRTEWDRSREEAELRQRLTAEPAPLPHAADADASTAIQVEAEALNELLAESDRLLR